MPYKKPSEAPKPERRAYPSDLTEAEWLLLEPLLPATRPRGQARIHSYRDLVDGMLYILRGGNAWRAIPHDLPPWQTVYSYFRDWQDDGTWRRVHDALMAADRETSGREAEPSAGSIDSQTVRTTERGAIAAMTGASAWSGASAI